MFPIRFLHSKHTHTYSNRQRNKNHHIQTEPGHLPNAQRREVDWEKVPFVPRPSLIAEPITAFGKKRPRNQDRPNILDPINRANIKPSAAVLARPIEPYVSARDVTRNRVAQELRRNIELRQAGGCAAITTDARSMDVVLPRLHQTAAVKPVHRHICWVESAGRY